MEMVWPVRKLFFIFFLLNLILLAACADSQPTASWSPDCDGLFFPIPTRPMQIDPDLSEPPPTFAPSGEGVTLCPTPEVTPTSNPNPAQQFIAGSLSNLSLDIGNQSLRSVTIGDDMLALGWLDGDEAVVGLAKGGNYLQIRPIEHAQDISVGFSRANRLHVATEVDGQIYYRIADRGAHPATSESSYVESGNNPNVLVDQWNKAYIVFERDGNIYRTRHLLNDQWSTNIVTDGTNPSIFPLYGFITIYFGGYEIEAQWFGVLLAANRNGTPTIYRYLSYENVWEQLAQFPVPAGEKLLGPTHLDYLASPDPSSEDAWAYASWVTVREATEPPPPTVIQPQFAPSNPLAPTAVANPGWLYADLNSARIYVEEATFDATLYQQVNVGTGNAVDFSAWGQCWSSAEDDPATSTNPANCRLAVGIDPEGGVNPNSPNVVWSGEQSPLNTFSPLSVNAISQQDTITVFMRAQPDEIKAHNEVYWDNAEINAGTLVNGDFEGAFSAYNGNTTLTVPDGWIPVFADASYNNPPARDIYTVYGAYSSDGGVSWSSPFIVTQNNSPSTGTTGAIAPDAYPLISFKTDPPSVTFFYIYESGDPPPDTQFLRFGRPYARQCELGTDVCNGDNPGQPLFSRQAVRPATSLFTVRDPFNDSFGLLAWESLQEDYENKDIFTTYAIMR